MSSLPTAELILVAAKRCVSERGPGKLTLSAVAAEAGVSRPTLYHWFPNKALLLGALSAYEVEQFDRGLQALVGAHRSPTGRLDATLRYLVTYLDDSMGPDPIGADPAFALQSLADSLGPHVDSLARVLGDGLDELPTVRAGDLSPHQAAEIFLRVAYSQYLVPHRDPEALLATLRSFAGLPDRTAVLATVGDARKAAGQPA